MPLISKELGGRALLIITLLNLFSQVSIGGQYIRRITVLGGSFLLFSIIRTLVEF